MIKEQHVLAFVIFMSQSTMDNRRTVLCTCLGNFRSNHVLEQFNRVLLALFRCGSPSKGEKRN